MATMALRFIRLILFMATAVQLSDLQKTYANGVQALRGVTLSIAEGEFFALLGPNGAGKSTAIGILSSLVRKTGGQVQVFGDDLERTPGRVKRHIGLVPQEFNFNQFEPVQEILLNQAGFYGVPRPEARVRSQSLLKQLDLWGKRDSQARELSGGMKRRLMIARALVHQPRLLILDEPTAGVDLEIRRSMWEFLRQLNSQGTTIILTTHYLEEAEQLCRHLAIINCGRIVENARMADLLRGLHAEHLLLSVSGTLPEQLPVNEFALRAVDESTLEAELKQGTSLNALFGCLSGLGVNVYSMRNRENRLERFFMERVQDKHCEEVGND